MEVITGIGEKEIIQKVVESVKKEDEARERLKKKQLNNIMFLYGEHYYDANRKSVNAEMLQRITWELEAQRKEGRAKTSSNYILPLFRSILSRMVKMKATFHVIPTTSSESDRDAAKVCKEALEEFSINCNKNNPWISMDYWGLEPLRLRMALYMLTLGVGYLKPEFNPKAQAMMFDEASGQPFQADGVGEAELRVTSILDVFRDRYNRWLIERRIMSPEQVEYEHGQKVSPTDLPEDTIEAQLRHLLDGEQETGDKEGVLLYEKTCIPTVDYPKGQRIVCTESKLLAKDDFLPPEQNGRQAHVEFRYQDLGFSRHAQGAIEQAIPLQEEYNFTISRIKQYKKDLTGKVMIPRGANISKKWDSEVGQIIHYDQGRRPTYESGANIPQYVFADLDRIKADMENLMNSHDVSMGRTPGQVKSGVGIENLTEVDNSMIAPELVMYEKKMSYVGSCILDIMQTHYTERRLLSMVGDDLTAETRSFISSEMMGQRRVEAKIGSNLPMNLLDRQNYIMNLQKIGWISPERAKELAEFGDVDGVFRSMDETMAKNDIIKIIQGWPVLPMGSAGLPMGKWVQPEPWDDATIRLKVINDFRKSPKYAAQPPQIRMAINALAAEYENRLLAEQQAAAAMGQGLPAPAKPPEPAPTGV